MIIVNPYVIRISKPNFTAQAVLDTRKKVHEVTCWGGTDKYGSDLFQIDVVRIERIPGTKIFLECEL